jgi:hypothetical protein
VTRSQSKSTPEPLAYVVKCTVHGVTRYFDGADFVTDKQFALQYATKRTAKQVAREQHYSCCVEPVE